ncbi:MAG: hypothetical protein V2A34_02295 [Lentisphaerota bacterium]
MDNLQPNRSQKEAWTGYGRAYTLAVQMALGMGGFTAGGYFLGLKTGCRKAGAVLGAAAGFAYILYEAWKQLRQMDQKKNAKSKSMD